MSGAQLAGEMRRGLLRVGVVSNTIGGCVSFSFLGFMLPSSFDDGDVWRVIAINTAVFAVYMPLTLFWGTRLTARRVEPVWRWLESERAPEPPERAIVLGETRCEAHQAAGFWAGALVLFTAVNVPLSMEFAIDVAVTITLGGITTTALLYLLVDRVLRPVTARVLAGEVPESPHSLGVRGRLTMAWALGTGVPLLGIAVLAVSGLLDEDTDVVVIESAALFLALIALAVGWFSTMLAARSVADPLTAVRGALAKIERGNFDARVPVDDGSEIGFLEAGFNRMAAGLRERELLREAFGTFVDPNLTERVLEEGTNLAGEEVELSVLFMDVRDFTSYAETADAQDVVRMLNNLYAEVVPVIARHGGHANKFVGDGLLAVFGAPERLRDHADRAVAAALEIAEVVRERFGDTLRVGVGVNSGAVVAGTIGGGGRLEFTVIGDVVNTAARVEAATRETGDDVLVTEETIERLSAKPDWEERRAIPLKGKSEDVCLYAPPQPATRPPAPARG